MLKQMKKTIGILLAVCFLISVTAATVSAGPVMVKEKKTAIVILKDVKTINLQASPPQTASPPPQKHRYE